MGYGDVGFHGQCVVLYCATVVFVLWYSELRLLLCGTTIRPITLQYRKVL